MIYMRDGQIGLPETGVLNDGRTVSGYNLLPEPVLLSEGWLPLVENKPEYNPETQELKLDGYTVEANRVVANYSVLDIVPMPSTEEVLSDLVDALVDKGVIY